MDIKFAALLAVALVAAFAAGWVFAISLMVFRGVI